MVNDDLINFVRSANTERRTKEDIYWNLIEKGWLVDDIQAAYAVVGKESQKGDSQKRTIHIVVTIGAILIAAGIFSFIASNWQGMSKATKIIIILVSMLTSYGLGWSLGEKRGYKKTGSALIFLGSLIFGAGIFLVGQMFNIRLNWPDGFILWMLGVLAMAFVTNTMSLYLLAIVVGFAAVIAHPIVLFGGFNPFLFTSSTLLLVATATTYYAGVVMYKRMPNKIS